jgi:hypothetical protein
MKESAKDGWDDESENMSRAKCKEEKEEERKRDTQKKPNEQQHRIQFNSRFPRRKIKLCFLPKDERWNYY